MKTLLVMGIGNILLRDEGAGVYCMRELKNQNWPGNVYFVDGGTFTQDLFYVFENYDHLLVLDAVRGGREPGTIYRLEEKDLVENQKQQISLHDIDLLDSLKMAELMGKKPDLTVLGIEPMEIQWEMGLTPEVQEHFPAFVQAAAKEISSILETMDQKDI